MTSPEQEATAQAAASAIDNAVKAPRRITLSNGIVLQGKAVPRAVMLNVVKQVPIPAIPVVEVENPEGGTRMEQNPNDPDYLAAVEAMHDARLEATYKAAYALGTMPVEIPEGVFPPDSPGWIEELNAVGLEPDIATPTRRYLSWLQMYALQTQQDAVDAYTLTLASTGIIEREVIEAVAYFRNRTQWGVVGIPPDPGDVGDGDNVQASIARVSA